MQKYLVGLLLCLSFSAHSFEVGKYVWTVEGQNIEMNFVHVTDSYFDANLKTYIKKFTDAEVLHIFNIYPAIMGAVHHIAILKDKKDQTLFCAYDIYAEEVEEVLQCGIAKQHSSTEWDLYDPASGVLDSHLSYKGKR